MVDILGKDWHPFVTFLDLTKSLPDYIDSVVKREAQGILYLTSQAKFELNQVYDMTHFESHPDLLHPFKCEEIDRPNAGGN